ncbi:Serine/threonine-protein kinase/endoribonuclease IRE1 [Orchesella cincta]|uniref:Serine/threonine-protein kinase/endoribonuclease IRE1 n=1 Tax=Orchesella cincta TaxID=48709 RepID=A0A1D2M4I9_ORCCI|nr:Serine/threonine-protein kinase/endoribonuclease IRE1 [Orchesella cincta]
MCLRKRSSGTFVFKGQFGNRDVAVKRMHSEVAREKAIIKEIEILKNCDSHENIVRYFATKVVQNFVLIVLELCDMTLAEWIITKPIYITPLEVLRQVTVGLEWLHEHSIVQGSEARKYFDSWEN